MCAARNQGRLGTISAGEAQGAFSVGDACEAFYVEDGKYYKAEIVRALGGGMYRINYVEYSFERDLKASEIKLPPGVVKKAPMTNGAPPRATPQVNGFSSGAQSMRVETRRPTASSSQTVRVAPTGKPPTPSGNMTQRQAPKTTAVPPRPHTNLPTVPPSGISAVALFEFRAAKATEIDLNPGDKIINIQQTGQWWTGTVNGRTGKFPYNYVELQQTSPAPSSSSSGGGGGSAAIPVPPRPTLRNNNASAAPPRPAFSGSASMLVKTARTPPAPPTARPAVTPRSAPTTPTIPTKSLTLRAEVPPPPTSPRKPAPAPVVAETPAIVAPVTRPPPPTTAKPSTPTPSPRPPPATSARQAPSIPSAPPRGASIAPATAPSISPRPTPSVPAKSTPPVPTKSTPPAPIPIPKEPLNPTPAAAVVVPPRPSAPSHTSPANDARSKRMSTKKLPPAPAKPAVPAAPVMGGGGGKVPPPPPSAPVGGGIPPPPPANGFTPPALTPSPPAPAKRAAPAAPAGSAFKAREAISAKWREDGQWYAAVVERVYEEGGVQYFDITFTEYGNTETYMTAAELKKLPGSKQEDDEPKPAPGSFAAALAAKANRLNQTGLKQEGEDVVEIAVTKKSGDIASSLEETKVTKRALAMSVYMLQDKMQGVDADEWEDDDDDVFDF